MTWRHVGSDASQQGIVFGTPKKVYSMFSWACQNCTIDPHFQAAPTPGTTGWQRLLTPAGMAMGAAQTTAVFDGTNYVIP